MLVATLNINSVNARLGNLCEWLKNNSPDVLLLQEIKCEFNNFPFFDLQTLGYDVKVLGQKSYNGVAVLSRHPLTVIRENLPDFPDSSARYLECEFTLNQQKYTVISLYLPNGNAAYGDPRREEKLQYKLGWMDAFLRHAENLLLTHKNIIIGGDFNVLLTPLDVYNPELFTADALYIPPVRNRMQYLLRCGYCDTFRTLHPEQTGYTFWDYTGGAFANDLGLRIDYILSSPAMTDRLVSGKTDKNFRSLEKSSDHTILTTEFKDLP